MTIFDMTEPELLGELQKLNANIDSVLRAAVREGFTWDRQYKVESYAAAMQKLVDTFYD